jgi:hypothetical protein
VGDALERDGEGHPLVGLGADALGHAVLGAVGPGIVHAQEDVDVVAVDVVQVEGEVLVGREVPAAAGRADGDAGPAVVMAGLHAQRRGLGAAAPGHHRRLGAHRRRIEAGVEGHQDAGGRSIRHRLGRP